MIRVEEAKKLIFDNTSVGQIMVNPLKDSVSEYLSKDIFSPMNMPPFRQSAMDGYALCLNQTKEYWLKGTIKAGDAYHLSLKKGDAVRVFTGAAVPTTANAVIMQEDVISKKNKIRLTKGVQEGANIRELGEQVTKGALALKKGTCLTPAAIGFLASLGIEKVAVYEKPSIAILVTGNELVKPGDNRCFGKVYESNSVMLQSALYAAGFASIKTVRVLDDYHETLRVLESLINENAVVLISGGISVGDYDFVGKALKALNVRQLFYKVNQKPGKPMFFGKKGTTLVFALPGNPAAALTSYYIYVYPALQKMVGALNYELKQSTARSISSFTKKGNRAQFLKAIYTNGEVAILDGQSSAMLQTFALANAFVYLSENLNKITIGDFVKVIHIPY